MYAYTEREYLYIYMYIYTECPTIRYGAAAGCASGTRRAGHKIPLLHLVNNHVKFCHSQKIGE